MAKVGDTRKVLRDLYDTLEKLRYPEIAQTRFEDFERTILQDTKRLHLLQWILEECPNFTSFSLEKIKDNAVNDKLFKCYSQMGFCTDQTLLFGECPIDKQLHLLALLTIFLKSIHFTKAKEPIDGVQTKNNSIEIQSENTDPNIICNNQDKIWDSTAIKADNLSNSLSNPAESTTKSGDLSDDRTGEQTANSTDASFKSLMDDSKFDDICSNIKRDIEEVSKQDFSQCESVLEKSNSSFKAVTSLAAQDNNSSLFSKYYSNLSADLNKVGSTFSIVDKTLNNMMKVRSLEIPEESSKIAQPLTEAIKQNLVLIEQACNICIDS